MPYIALVILIFLIELIIKNYIEKHKTEGRNEKALGGLILLTKYHNRGAFLEAGKRCRVLVKIASILMTIGVLLIFIVSFGQKGNHMLRLGLALLLGGAFSNTYDRVARKYVVDYFRLNVPWNPLKRVIFNIADFCIIIGVLLIMLKG